MYTETNFGEILVFSLPAFYERKKIRMVRNLQKSAMEKPIL